MKLSDLKRQLLSVTELSFRLPDGTFVPKHFHVTEVGQINKHFIDCGGTVRHEKTVSFQLWKADDIDHRLAPKKLMDIITLSEKTLAIEDAEIEVEYQSSTIGKYGLEFSNGEFLLTVLTTACLASDQCGVPEVKKKIRLSDLGTGGSACCTTGGGCC